VNPPLGVIVMVDVVEVPAFMVVNGLWIYGAVHSERKQFAE
jgi:hypothetical protein